eukprot:3622554-Pleurochrysis_carterae.AAC.1
MHLAAISDLAWLPSGNGIVVASTDGYCSLIAFEPGALGNHLSKASDARPRLHTRADSLKAALAAGPPAHLINLLWPSLRLKALAILITSLALGCLPSWRAVPVAFFFGARDLAFGEEGFHGRAHAFSLWSVGLPAALNLEDRSMLNVPDDRLNA